MCSALRSFVFLQNQHFPDQNIYVHTFVKDICLWKKILMEIFPIAEFWIYTAKCLPFTTFTLYQKFAGGVYYVTLISWGILRVKWSFLYLVQDVPKTNIHIYSQEEGNYGSKHSLISFIILILNVPATQSFITCSEFTKIKVKFDIIYTF